eukprot:3150068-Rhodomonas_salina.1
MGHRSSEHGTYLGLVADGAVSDDEQHVVRHSSLGRTSTAYGRGGMPGKGQQHTLRAAYPSSIP